jgi:phage gp36-like protein
MMDPYATPKHVTDLILKEVTSAAEALNDDLVARCLADATGEVASLLAIRYRQPFAPVPEIIRWITSVIAAWRVVGAITSLMDTEASADNQWLPIQKQYDKAWALLDDLAKGRVKLPAKDGTDPDREAAHAAVVSPGNYFDLKGF